MSETPGFERRYRYQVFWALTLLVLVAMFFVIGRFIPAILWAAVLSILTRPLYLRLSKRFNESLSAAIVVVGLILVFVIPVGAIGVAGYVQVTEVVSEIRADSPDGRSGLTQENVLKRIDALVDPIVAPFAKDFKISRWYAENREELGKRATELLGPAAQSILWTALTMIVALLTMFFMLRDGPRLLEPTLDLMPLPREASLTILEKMAETVRAVFIGVVLVALIQGTIAGITYWAIGIPSPIVWGLATTVLCVIPLLGSPVILIPMAIFLLAQGQIVEAIVLLAVGFGIITQVDNLLRPWMIGSRIKSHYITTFFSLLGGVLAFGPVGIMVGPVLLTLLLGLVDVIRERRRLELKSAPEMA